MNKEFAWKLFKNTGNIDAYMLMKDVEYGEEQLAGRKENASNVLGELDGINKDKGDSNKGC